MKKITFIIFFLLTLSISAQSIVGKWKILDEKTDKVKFIVDVYQENEKIYGKIINIKDTVLTDSVCANCEDVFKNKPYQDMMLINGLTQNNNEWSSGYVLNTQDGVLYKTNMRFEDENTLRLHEYDWFLKKYHGYTTFGRNTYWYRVRESL